MSDASSTSGSTYPCSLCPRAYKRREHLHRHVASHSSVRPYRCTLCNQSYQRADILRRHVQTCQTKPRIGGTLVSSNRRACDLCVRQKKACSMGQPCNHCRQRSVECSYSFGLGAVESSGRDATQDVELGSFIEIQPLTVTGSNADPPPVVFGDDSLFGYLGSYTSVSDMLEGSDNNQDWLDFVGLATGTFQPSSTNAKTRLDNYTFHFLDNFTKRSGLVESFDCGTFEQRVQVVSNFLETEGYDSTLAHIDSAMHQTMLPIADLPDPLIIQTHQILLDVKEVVTVKPRNSVVSLEWSTILEQTCMQFFSPPNLRRFLELFWQIWHPNVNFVHRPTFEPASSKSILVAAMALIGSYSSPFALLIHFAQNPAISLPKQYGLTKSRG